MEGMDAPTPRELLIAWHADRGRPRREGCGSAATVASWARRAEWPLAEAPPAALAAYGDVAAAAAAMETAAAAAAGARLVTLLDPDYPPALAAIEQAPPVLALRGELPRPPAVAIVGSRLGDSYGREVAARFAHDLAAAGLAIVSGLARGIDAAAHAGALTAPAGVTVAVLGCGLGLDYPRAHTALAAAVARRGALVSEFPCAAPPRRWHFPVRNRVIAALAGATLVVQATPRSGSLITAQHARRLGRLVFAVPGPVFEPLSWGPHALLRSGARLATHPQDLLDVLIPGGAGDGAEPGAQPDAQEPPWRGRAADGGPAGDPGEPVAAAVLAALSRRGARSAEQVAARAGISAGAALAALFELELADRVERLQGMSYRLAKSGATLLPVRHTNDG
jgi:DNA processing protein